MDKHIILSVISNDHPGIVKDIANVISDHGGSWLESSLTQLAGKFAGVIRVSISENQQETLKVALEALITQGIKVVLEEIDTAESSQDAILACFSAVGPDRKGIVREIAQAFSQYQINLENLNTRCTSAPYSGDPMFEAEGELSIPPNTPMEEVYDQLSHIADLLAIDIHLEEIQ